MSDHGLQSPGHSAATAEAVNRTIQLGNHAHSWIDIGRFGVESVCMQNTQNTNRTNTINDSESLLQLLSERLHLWDQQDAAQAGGASPGADAGANGNGASSGATGGGASDDVIDAEFTETK